LALGLLLVAGCATRQLSDEPAAPQQPAAASSAAPAKAAPAPSSSAPLAAAKSRESDLSDHDLAQLRQNLGKDAFDQTGTASWGDMPGLTAAHSSLPVGAKVEITNLDNSRRTVVMITDRSPSGGRTVEVSRSAAAELGMLDSGTATVGLRVLDRPKGKSAKKAPAKKAAAAPRPAARPQALEDDDAVTAADMVTADEAAAPAKKKAPAKEQPAAKAKTAAKQAAPAKPAAQAKAAGGKYFVQVGSFSSPENAEKLVKRLKAQGYGGSRQKRAESGGKVLYRVQAGSFPDKAAAEAALKALKGEFPSGYILAD
jgi:rare lipoprotein A